MAINKAAKPTTLEYYSNQTLFCVQEKLTQAGFLAFIHSRALSLSNPLKTETHPGPTVVSPISQGS